MDTLIAWIMRCHPFGTIIMYGAMGEIVTEKCGNLNLGVPGIMYLGGFAGFASAYLYENTAANRTWRSRRDFAALRLRRVDAGRPDLQLFDHQPARQSKRDRPCADHVWHGAWQTFSAYTFSTEAPPRRAWSTKPFRPSCPCFPVWALSAKRSSTTVSWSTPPSFWPSSCIES